MTATRKRVRRERSSPTPATPRPTPAAQPAGPPLPAWKWRTFPVYFAFSLALFIGVYVGMLAYAARDNSNMALLVTAVPAVMLGLGFSRIMLRLMMTRGVIKPRSKRK